MAEPAPSSHIALDEIESTFRHVEPRPLVERNAGIHERSNHQYIPVGQHFVVASRAHAHVAYRKQLGAQLGQSVLVLHRSCNAREPVENAMAFEIAIWPNIVVAGEVLAIFST